MRPQASLKKKLKTSKREKKGKKVRISLSILSFLILSSCDSFRLKYVFVLDTQHQICAQKEIISTNPLKFRHVTDLPIEHCDGGVLIQKEDFLPFKRWAENIQTDYEDLKKKCGAVNGI